MGSANSKILEVKQSKERDAVSKHVMESMLMRAIEDQDGDYLYKLARYVDVNALMQSGDSLLTYAVTEGHLDIVTGLIEIGADVNKPDANERTALHAAIISGHDQVVGILLTYGADSNVCDSCGLNALHIAAQLGRRSMLPKLLAMGAKPNEPCRAVEKATPLILASANGHVDCISILVSAGGSLDVADTWGNTPLNKAAGNDHLDCVKTLLDHGCNINARNRSGTTALQYAIIRGNHDMARLLLQRKSSVNKYSADLPPLHATALSGCTECLHILVSNRANIECIDRQRRTALYNAVTDLPNIEHYYRYYPILRISSRVDCAKALIDYGANAAKIWKTKFWNTRYRSAEQIALYRLCLRAYGFPTPLPLQELFTKVALSGCTSTMQLFVAIGYNITQNDVERLSYLNQEPCKCSCYKFELTARSCHVTKDVLRRWLELTVQQPRTLKDISRLKVRACIFTNVFVLVKRLDIPQDIRDFLTINDC